MFFFFFLNQAKTTKTNVFLQSLNIKGKLPTFGALLIKKKKLKVRIIKMGGKGVSCKARGPDFEFQDPHSRRKKTDCRVVL